MRQRLLAVALLALATLPVHAAEETVNLSPFAGNFGNAVWTLVIFVLVVAVLGKFAWGPVLGLLKEREDFIHKSLQAAKQDREKAEASLREYTEKLRAARAEAEQIIATSRADAERLREQVRSKAQEEGATIVKNAERRIQLETERALQQIRHEVADLSVMIASKLIKRNLSKEDNEQLIAEALSQVEAREH
jgi:F-type H+-transporting ATPase subunit b